MMAPTVVMLADRRSRRSPIGGEVELVLGSAGSNRIRSALLQTIVGVVDHGLGARAAVDAPRVHIEDGTLYTEPGIDLEELLGPDSPTDPGSSSPVGPGLDLPTDPGSDSPTDPRARVVEFGALNLFFGGVQAVLRRGDAIEGAGDPRRGGVAVRA